MAKKLQIKSERPIRSQMDNLAHGVKESRFAVGRQPHQFVLIAVVGKSKILRQSLIEDAKRMREMHPRVNSQARLMPHSPCSAREVTEPIDGHNCGFVEWRDVKCG